MKFRLGWSRIVLAIYVLLLAVTYVLMRKDIVGEVFTGIVFSWQLLILFLGLARITTRPVALGLILTFVGAFTLLPLFTDVFPVLTGLVSNQKFWIIVPVFVAAVIIVSEIVRYRRAKAEKRLRPAVQSGLGEDGMLYERVSFASRNCIVEEGVLTGGNVHVNSGTAVIDLSRCSLADGISVIDMDIIMGSVCLVLPHDWYVELRTSGFAGKARDTRSGAERKASRTLLVKGNITFGSLVVKEADLD